MSFPNTIYDGVARAKVTSAAQGEAPLGTRLVVPDGRVFRYAQAGATALQPFCLVGGAALGPWSTMSASGANWSVQRVTSYEVGATQILFSYGATGSVAADGFRDGYMIVGSTDTAEAQFAALGSHGALASSTILANLNYVNIPDGLDLALPTETDCWPRLVPNPYKGVIVTNYATILGGILGVPIVPVAISYYFWLQTWGPCAVIQDTGAGDIGTAQPGVQVWSASGSTGGICAMFTCSASGFIPWDTDCGRALMVGPVGTLMQSSQLNAGHAMINLRLAA